MKAIIWGSGVGYQLYAEYIYREADSGRMELVGITGEDTIYKRIDRLPFLAPNELEDIDYDFLIAAVSNEMLPDIYHEAALYGIERDRFIRADVFSLPHFNIEKYMILREKPVSLISQTCFGGFLYHRLDLPFASPTINLYFRYPDFIKFSASLPEYINSQLEFDSMGYEKNLKRDFPVMRLRDIKIYFNHYTSIGEATEKWYKRCQHINYDSILVVTYSDKPEKLKEFMDIPYRKCCFTSFRSDVPNTVYLPVEQGKEFWQMINKTAKGTCQCIDPIKFMLGEPDFLRCEFK